MQISNRVLNLGTESAFEVLAKAEDLTKQGADIINLGIGQPDFLTSEHIVESGCKSVKRRRAWIYSSLGIKSFTKRFVRNILENIKSVDPNVLITPGGKLIIFFVVCIFGGNDVEILYPNPGFPIYESVINYSGKGYSVSSNGNR